MPPEDVFARHPAEEDRLEGAEEPRRGQRSRASPRSLRRCCERRARVAERQPGPLREVSVLGGAVAGEIAASELGERALPVDPRLRTEPVAHERVRVLPADHRPSHDQPAQRREHQDVDECLALRRDAGAVEAVAELDPRQRPVVRDRTRDGLHSPLRLRRRDALLRQAPRIPGEERRRRQRVQPPVVLAADEVERPAVEPRHDERAVIRERAVHLGRGDASGAGADG